jgi:hypothetical protein
MIFNHKGTKALSLFFAFSRLCEKLKICGIREICEQKSPAKQSINQRDPGHLTGCLDMNSCS